VEEETHIIMELNHYKLGEKMEHFGAKLRFGLVKSINEDSSLIYVVIPEVILKFLIQFLNILCFRERNVHLTVPFCASKQNLQNAYYMLIVS
jgi:hypothetical protein